MTFVTEGGSAGAVGSLGFVGSVGVLGVCVTGGGVGSDVDAEEEQATRKRRTSLRMVTVRAVDTMTVTLL